MPLSGTLLRLAWLHFTSRRGSPRRPGPASAPLRTLSRGGGPRRAESTDATARGAGAHQDQGVDDHDADPQSAASSRPDQRVDAAKRAMRAVNRLRAPETEGRPGRRLGGASLGRR